MSFCKYIPDSLEIDPLADIVKIQAVSYDEMAMKFTATHNRSNVDDLITQLQNQQEFGVAFRGGVMKVSEAVGHVHDRGQIILSLDGEDILINLPEDTDIPIDAEISSKGYFGVRDSEGYMLSGMITTPAPEAESNMSI